MTAQPPATAATPAAAPALPTPARTGGHSVLSADLRIVGDITAEGTVEVMGEIEGSLRAASLIVTNEGRVTGTVSAESVEVRGKFEGGIGTGSLMLRSAANVRADATYRTLAIESGATVEGSFRKPKA